jgi:ParB/RepB/Spo0J family partition protein
VQVVKDVPVGRVRPDPGQPRKDFGEEGLEQLASSLRSEGLLQPIVVRPDGEGGYVIVAGERRWRAARMLGWETIPAIVRDGLDEGSLRKLQLLENVVRQDLSPVELARAYRAMMEQGMTAQEIGRAVGKDPGTVTWLVQILDCREDVLHLVHRGQIAPTLAWYLSKLSPGGQARALREITGRGLRLQEAISVCNRIWAEEAQAQAFAEERLSKERARAMRGFRRAFERACQAIDSLWRYEERAPGTLKDALGSEIDVARLKVRELKRAVERLERLLEEVS